MRQDIGYFQRFLPNSRGESLNSQIFNGENWCTFCGQLYAPHLQNILSYQEEVDYQTSDESDQAEA